MKLLNTSSKRIAGTFALIQALLVAGALLFVQWQADRAVISNAMEENREALEAMTQIATRNGLDAVLAEIAAQAQPEHRAKVIALRQADGRILAGNLEVWPDSLGPNMTWQVMTIRLKGAATTDEVGLSTRRISGGVIILHGSVLSTHRSISVAVKTAFSWVFLLTVLLSIASAFLFSRFLDRRIEQFAWAADAVSRGDLTRRIDRRPTNDAFDHLANSINGMLDNIERLVGELRGVTDMLAHDLRSPLSRLSLKLERGLTRTEDPEAITALTAAQDIERTENE
jgi:HAMP domain-containing protein